jgi:hypothetical protein
VNHVNPTGPVVPAAEVDRLLEQAETDLAGLDRLSTSDQVAGFDRIHDSLAQALDRTIDSPAPPARPVPGRPGA